MELQLPMQPTTSNEAMGWSDMGQGAYRIRRKAWDRRIIRSYYASKISGDQIVRSPASANIDLGSGGTYQITVGIESVQKARFIRTSIWLNAPQCAFVYEKRCFYRAIVPPKSHGTPRSII
jgi:hypothetical protein